jgi:hypothetical protein
VALQEAGEASAASAGCALRGWIDPGVKCGLPDPLFLQKDEEFRDANPMHRDAANLAYFLARKAAKTARGRFFLVPHRRRRLARHETVALASRPAVAWTFRSALVSCQQAGLSAPVGRREQEPSGS